ncbi:hypothetical protein ALC57_17658 [Trachymyrmex cornetzi]|uniref:Mos1 transposase HTH domain-containing protein n=1 Tax=Trachymyrmex cornetzi TaxID=471704 RepID=A0A151IT83_9HYME|nr:hypothetical protein ALC57_17658 [Trachymyrmex cornetzi]
MEQRVCINFCVKNGIKCSKTLEMLIVAYGESTLSKKMFINGISYSKRAEVMKHGKLKRPMKGRRFATIEEIKAASLEELKAIPKSAFQKCFDDWKKRWHKCIISEGDNFEGDNIILDE